MEQQRGEFKSKFGVIAAAAGAAIGLGNIWRFPYVLGQNGGGAFLLIYLLFIIALGIPLMLSELTIGRLTSKNPVGAFKQIGGKKWAIIGFLSVVAPLLTLTFYSAIAGYTMQYIFFSATQTFDGQSTEQLTQMYNTYIASDTMPVIWTIAFLIITAVIVLAGVEKGIEKYTKMLMPLLFLIILILCIRSVTLDGAMQGIEFLFKPDFSKLTPSIILEALGQAFFSLSLGMGVIITYGSYIKKNQNLVSTAVSVSISDTMIALLSGIAIFPAVFAFGIDAGSGPGLVFITLPNVFQQMAGGTIFAFMFFFLLFIAAITTSISLLEVVVATLHEELKISRFKATIIATAIIMFLGCICALSKGGLADVKLFGLDISDLLEYIASTIILPITGLFTVILIGYIFSIDKIKEEIAIGASVKYFGIYTVIIKYIAPVAIFLVLLMSLKLF